MITSVGLLDHEVVTRQPERRGVTELEVWLQSSQLFPCDRHPANDERQITQPEWSVTDAPAMDFWQRDERYQVEELVRTADRGRFSLRVALWLGGSIVAATAAIAQFKQAILGLFHQ